MNEGQLNSITTGMIENNTVESGKIVDSTIAQEDVASVFKSPYADTADYALGANVNYVNSADVAVNAWNWNNNTWNTEYPMTLY